MTPTDIAGLAFLGAGFVFFLGGAVGVLRFPDACTRLHALTKADNLGLGLTAIGVGLIAGSWAITVKLALVWFFVALSGAAAAHLIARHVLRAAARGTRP